MYVPIKCLLCVESFVSRETCRVYMKYFFVVFPSKTRKVLCGYCSVDMKEVNLTTHCKTVHGKPKLIKGEKDISLFWSKSNSKRADTRTEDQTPAFVPGTSAVDSVEPYDEAVSKDAADNLSDDNKLDTIISKLHHLDLKLGVHFSKTVPPVVDTAPAHENPSLPADTQRDIDEKMRGCKSIQDLVNEFEQLCYIQNENSLVCTVCVLHPTQGANIPGSFLIDGENV